MLAVFLLAACTFQSELAFAHGGETLVCTVGGSCVETTAPSPIYVMFVILGLFGALFFTHNAYEGRYKRQRMGAIFNIFN